MSNEIYEKYANLRKNMPQVKIDKALKEYFISEGLDSYFTKRTVSDLIPTQKDFNKNKIKQMVKRFKKGDLTKPLLITNKGEIVDGHHRWKAVSEIDPTLQFECLEVVAKYEKLIKALKKYDGTSYKSLSEFLEN